MLHELFVKATRNKFRFQSTVGELTVEQLWDLDLEHKTKPNLDNVYKNINKQIRDSQNDGDSYLTKQTKDNNELNEKLEIIKYIMDTKLLEKKEAISRKETTELYQKLLRIKADKTESELLNLTSEQIDAKIAELSAKL